MKQTAVKKATNKKMQQSQKKKQHSDNMLLKIGATLRERRLHLSLEIQQLALMSNTSTVLISQIERGLVSSVQLAKLQSICNSLDFNLILSLEEK